VADSDQFAAATARPNAAALAACSSGPVLAPFHECVRRFAGGWPRPCAAPPAGAEHPMAICPALHCLADRTPANQIPAAVAASIVVVRMIRLTPALADSLGLGAAIADQVGRIRLAEAAGSLLDDCLGWIDSAHQRAAKFVAAIGPMAADEFDRPIGSAMKVAVANRFASPAGSLIAAGGFAIADSEFVDFRSAGLGIVDRVVDDPAIADHRGLLQSCPRIADLVAEWNSAENLAEIASAGRVAFAIPAERTDRAKLIACFGPAASCFRLAVALTAALIVDCSADLASHPKKALGFACPVADRGWSKKWNDPVDLSLQLAGRMAVVDRVSTAAAEAIASRGWIGIAAWLQRAESPREIQVGKLAVDLFWIARILGPALAAVAPDQQRDPTSP